MGGSLLYPAHPGWVGKNATKSAHSMADISRGVSDRDRDMATTDNLLLNSLRGLMLRGIRFDRNRAQGSTSLSLTRPACL